MKHILFILFVLLVSCGKEPTVQVNPAPSPEPSKTSEPPQDESLRFKYGEVVGYKEDPFYSRVCNGRGRIVRVMGDYVYLIPLQKKCIMAVGEPEMRVLNIENVWKLK